MSKTFIFETRIIPGYLEYRSMGVCNDPKPHWSKSPEYQGWYLICSQTSPNLDNRYCYIRKNGSKFEIVDGTITKTIVDASTVTATYYGPIPPSMLHGIRNRVWFP